MKLSRKDGVKLQSKAVGLEELGAKLAFPSVCRTETVSIEQETNFQPALSQEKLPQNPECQGHVGKPRVLCADPGETKLSAAFSEDEALQKRSESTGQQSFKKSQSIQRMLSQAVGMELDRNSPNKTL